MDALITVFFLVLVCACFFLLGYQIGGRHARRVKPEQFHARLFDGGFNAYVTFETDVPEGDMLRFIDAIRPFVEICEDERAAKRRESGA